MPRVDGNAPVSKPARKTAAPAAGAPKPASGTDHLKASSTSPFELGHRLEQAVSKLGHAAEQLAADQKADPLSFALRQLPADQQARYHDVYEALDPDGKQALQSLLTSDQLGQKDLTGKGTVLDHLQDLLTEPHAGKLTGKDLVQSAVEAIADPSKITQGVGRATCESTTVEWMLANQNKSEFVRLLAGLASTDGKVTTVSGKELTADPASLAPDDSGRSTADRLLQSAFQKDGRGILGYHDHPDIGTWGPIVQTGLTPGGVHDLIHDVLGENTHIEGSDTNYLAAGRGLLGRIVTGVVDPTSLLTGSGSPAELLDDIRKDTQAGHLVATEIDIGDGSVSGMDPHYITVSKVENGRVYFRNPWGETAPVGSEIGSGPNTRRMEADGLESMPVARFQNILIKAQIVGNYHSGPLGLPKVNVPGPSWLSDAASVVAAPITVPVHVVGDAVHFLTGGLL